MGRYCPLQKYFFIANPTYKWQFQHDPFFNALFDEKLNDDNEVVYLDLASAYHYLNTSNINELENHPDMKTLLKSPWLRLRVLEDELLGDCVEGAGSKTCTLGQNHGDHRPSMWPPSFSYNKVDRFSRQAIE